MNIRHIILLLLLSLSLTTNASMQDVYDDWFNQMGSYTAPGKFESGMANGYFGGRFTVKTPITSVKVANFSPPSISAGCGGVDFFGGSFSFIDAAQFEELLRNVAQNAKGYMFHLLLDNVFPEGSKIIEVIQKKIQELNQMMGNSCQLAQGLVDAGRETFQDGKLKETTAKLVDAGTYNDMWDSFSRSNLEPIKQAWDDDITDWKNKLSGADPDINDCNDAARHGNKILPPTYNAFWFLMGCKRYKEAFPDTYGDEYLENMMSIYGTFVNISDLNITEDFISGVPYHTPVMSFLDLLHGGIISKFVCKSHQKAPEKFDPLGCLNIDVEFIELKSFQESVKVLLLGDPSSIPVKHGIVELIKTNRGADISDEQKKALTALGPYVSNIRNIVLKSPGHANDYIEKAIEPIAVYALEDLIKRSYVLLTSALSSASDKPEIAAYMDRVAQNHRVIIDEIESVKVSLKTLEGALSTYANIMTTTRSTNYLPQRPIRAE